MAYLSSLRYFRRSIGRSPGIPIAFWFCTVIWMAVGPAFLSLLGSLEWKSFPFPASSRIVHVNAGFDLLPSLTASGRFRAFSAYEAGWFVLEGPRATTSVAGAAVDAEFFQVFEMRARAGRVFAVDSAGADAGGAVLTESLSRHLFGTGTPSAKAVLRVNDRELAVLWWRRPRSWEYWFTCLSARPCARCSTASTC